MSVGTRLLFVFMPLMSCGLVESRRVVTVVDALQLLGESMSFNDVRTIVTVLFFTGNNPGIRPEVTSALCLLLMRESAAILAHPEHQD